MNAGLVINRLRRAKGMSQKKLSEEIDVARTYLAQVESGKREPGLVLLRDVSRVLGIPVALLLAHESGPDSSINNELRKLLEYVLEAREEISKQTNKSP